MSPLDGCITAAVLAAALAIWPVPRPASLPGQAAFPGPAGGRPGRRGKRRWGVRRRWWSVAGGIVISSLSLTVAPVAVIVGAALIGGAAARLLWRARAGSRRQHTRRHVAAGFAALVRELDAGAGPEEAVQHVVAHTDSSRTARALLLALPAGHGVSGEHGVPGELRGADVDDGLRDLWHRARRAWQLSARAGVPLARLLASMVQELGDDAATERHRAAQTAGPAMSGYLLAVLPAAGLALGIGMGTHPVAVLWGTQTGSVLLVAGAGLCAAGLLWTDRIVHR